MTVASCRRLELDESMNAVRECKAMAEEDSWSGLNQVRERVRKINQGDWKSQEEVWSVKRGRFARISKRAKRFLGVVLLILTGKETNLSWISQR